MGKDKQQETLKALRQAVWEKAIGNTEITPGSYYWKKIGQAIEDTLGNSHPLHPDTIRNFFKGRHYPRPDTLDIFSRYVLGDAGAPKIFLDFEQHYLSQEEQQSPIVPDRNIGFRVSWRVLLFFLAAISLAIIGFFSMPGSEDFQEDFEDVSDAALAAKGWMLQDPDSAYWRLRDTNSGFLTLYTLKGDNWVGEGEQPFLKNRLTRGVNLSDSYEIEFELRSFFPMQNYQQCGILLMADSSLSSEMIRLCVSYGQFGRPLKGYLGLQSAYFEAGEYKRPIERSWHYLGVPIDSFESYRSEFEYIVVRINVTENVLRVHTSHGPGPSFAIHERIKDITLGFQPRYLSLYAAGSQYSTPHADTIPAKFERISIKNL